MLAGLWKRVLASLTFAVGSGCAHVTRTASDELDGKRLGFFRNLVYRAHLATCAWCNWYVENLRSMRANLETCDETREGRVDPSPRLSVEAKERIIRHMHDQK